MRSRIAALLTGPVRAGLLTGVLAVAALSAVGALAPRLIDLRGLAPVISAELGRALGEDVRVRGGILLSLVPAPQLIISDIATAETSASGLRLRAPEARARLDWGDLLLGRYTMSRLTLVRPEIETPWAVVTGFATGPVELGIESGRLSLTGPGIPLVAEGLEASVAAGRLQAVATFEGQTIDLNVKSVSSVRGGAQRIQAMLRLPEADVQLELAGAIAQGEFKGTAALTALRLGDLLALSRATDIDPLRFAGARRAARAKADVVAGPSRVSLQAGELEIGGDRATFWATVIPGLAARFSVGVELGDVDVTPWLPEGAAADTQSAAMPRVLDRLLTEAAWDGEVKVTAPVLHAGATVLRDAVLEASLAVGQDGAARWLVNTATLGLPGQTNLAVSGLWEPAAGALDGTWRVQSQDLRTLLEWSGVVTEGIKREALVTLAASGALQADRRVLVLNDISAAFDASRASGRIALGWDQRTPASLSMDIDRLALDVYWPLLGNGVARAAAQSPREAPGYGVTPLAPWLADWAQRRGTVRIAVGQLSWGDAVAGRFGLDVALGEGAADVRSLAFDDGAGLSIWLGGKLTGLGGLPAADGLRLDVRVADAMRLGRLLGIEMPAPLRALSPWSLTAGLNGSLIDAVLAAEARFGDVVMSARGAVGFESGAPKVDIAARAGHPDAAALRGLLWRGAAFESRLTGPVSLEAKLRLQGQRATLDDVRMTAGGQSFAATAVVDAAADPKAVAVNVTDIDLDWSALTPLPLLPLPAPGRWQGAIALSGPRLIAPLIDARDFAARIVAAPNAVELAEWSGKFFGGGAQLGLKWSKEVGADDPARWRHRLQGQIALSGAEPSRLLTGLGSATKGQADLAMNFSALAQRPEDWAQTVSGAGRLQVRLPQGTTFKTAGALAPLAAVVQAETMDTRAAAAITADAEFSLSGRGVAFSELAVRSNAYNATFSGGVDFGQQSYALNGQLRLKDRGLIAGPSAKLVLPPNLSLSITGPFAAPTIKMNAVQR